LIPELTRDTIIEISAAIENGVIHASPPRRLPPPGMMGMLSANAAYEQTLVDAILKDSSDLLLEAFLINPLILSYDVAKMAVEELWPRRGWPETYAAL
jgi:alpha-galactosidase/6-phospho-beta-glucosidase family protein